MAGFGATRVRLDLTGLTGLMRSQNSRHPAFRAMLKQILKYYERFTRRRFQKASNGDGTWVPLSPATIRSRRKGKRFTKNVGSRNARKKGAAKILRDTSTLFRALSLGSQGNFSRIKRTSVQYGFAKLRHPHSKKRGKTIRDIAVIHDEGRGVPKRTILEVPDRRTKILMLKAVRRGERKILRQMDRQMRRRLGVSARRSA